MTWIMKYNEQIIRVWKFQEISPWCFGKTFCKSTWFCRTYLQIDISRFSETIGEFLMNFHQDWMWNSNIAETAFKEVSDNIEKKEHSLKFWGLGGAQVCKSCRSRQELSHEYVVLTSKNRRRHSREGASQRLEVIQFIHSFASSLRVHQ